MFAIELEKEQIDTLFTKYSSKETIVTIDVTNDKIVVNAEGDTEELPFKIRRF